MTNWEPVFITLENSLHREKKGEEQGGRTRGRNPEGQREGEGIGGDEEEDRVRLVVLNQT